MFTDFGLPPQAFSTRQLVDQRLNDRRETNGVAETLTVDWRDSRMHIEVIDMPIHALSYNPGTHRIRAQRSLDPARDAVLASDPWMQESQDYLRYLLTVRPSEPDKRDPDFETLKESLKNHRQNEPGLITRDGILVNGNTRCAALQELDPNSSMRVGVLPASCSWQDINNLEISLQLLPDERREYSYINRLLAIEEQRIHLNRELPAIAATFRTDVRSCERDLWVLAQLQDLIERSKTADGPTLRLMDLERSQEKLAELYRAYTKEHAKNKERADLLKEARLAAIVLDFSKTDVRYIEPDFQVRYLERELPAELSATEVATPATVSIPGLNRSIGAPSANIASARSITDTLIKAKAVQAAGADVDLAMRTTASGVIASFHQAFNDALENAGRDARLKKKRLAAPDRIANACRDLEQSVNDIVASRASASLDEGAFDDALIQLRTVLRKVVFEGHRSIELPGEGLSWLTAAVDVKQA
ncbi:transcriptional regulator [Nocardia sp. NPDC058497]|uniref:transcriptional regulator n=1 Tax=Nocardia sp. NPDC058497 TaxID=3346529 RepID=UPI00365931A3